MKYTLPAKKKESLDKAVPAHSSEDYINREVDIAASAEMLEAVSVGKELSMTLTGTVIAVHASSKYDGPGIRLEVSQVELPYSEENEFSKLADSQFDDE